MIKLVWFASFLLVVPDFYFHNKFGVSALY